MYNVHLMVNLFWNIFFTICSNCLKLFLLSFQLNKHLNQNEKDQSMYSEMLKQFDVSFIRNLHVLWNTCMSVSPSRFLCCMIT